jgi:bacterioferritin
MQGDPKTIHHLQAQLRNELTITSQYRLHHHILQHWGLETLARREHDESVGEMEHADRLMARILTLGGMPQLQELGKLMGGQDVPQILDCDLRGEHAAQITLKEGIAHCEVARDYVSRQLLLDLLQDTEGQIAYLETQLDLINKVGLPNYLQSQMGQAAA